MKLKSYHAETVEAAVRLAGIELGASAVFLGSRTTDGEGGRYEVTFAVPEPPPTRSGTGDQQSPAALEPTDPAAHATALEGGDAPRVSPTASLLSFCSSYGEAPVPAGGLPHWKKFVPPFIDDVADGTRGPEPVPAESQPTGLASEGWSEGNLPMTSFGPLISQAATPEPGVGGSFDARPERPNAAMASGATGAGASRRQAARV